ncbi:MAG: hypothetical protein JXR96_20840 [Deltaproteobacteria bacterium]|nr:hypothetical protein [Deltaproteobacteria bacterium]
MQTGFRVLDEGAVFIHQLESEPRAARAFELQDRGGVLVGRAREELGPRRRVLRLAGFSAPRPFRVRVEEIDGRAIVEMEREIGFMRDRIAVADGQGRRLGQILLRLPLLGDKRMLIQNPQGIDLARLQVAAFRQPCAIEDASGARLGELTQKWAGLGRELLGTADDYLLCWDESAEPSPALRRMVLAAALAFDLVFRED